MLELLANICWVVGNRDALERQILAQMKDYLFQKDFQWDSFF
jgi:hypothetical protein